MGNLGQYQANYFACRNCLPPPACLGCHARLRHWWATEDELRGEVVTALDALATGLAEDRPIDEAACMERLRSYLDDHPAFYGSAAALLDRDGRVTASPYVYRAGDGYATLDLAVPSYNIDSQAGSRNHWPKTRESGRLPTSMLGAARSGW